MKLKTLTVWVGIGDCPFHVTFDDPVLQQFDDKCMWFLCRTCVRED